MVNLWPKKKRVPKGSVVTGHVYLMQVLPPDGTMPELMMQYEGDYTQLQGMLTDAQLELWWAERENKGDWK